MIRKAFIFFSLLLNSNTLYASFGDTFGASTQAMAKANQMNSTLSSAENNFYAPSALAIDPNLSLSLSTSLVSTNFREIEDILQRSPINSNVTEQRGDVDTDYDHFYGAFLHAGLPLGKKSALGLSFATPIGHIMEFNTGDAFLPEYVMHRARYDRTHLAANFAHSFGQDNKRWALSLGAHLGFQTAAQTTFNAALTGSNQGSSSDTKTKAKPALGAILSATKQWGPGHFLSLTYTQEMKNKLSVEATGFTANPPTAFESKLDNMLYYDPHSLRLSHNINFLSFSLTSSLEYQHWQNYETPVTRMTSQSGINSSDDFEQIDTRNILIPRIGLKWQTTEKLNLLIGFSHRQTPIKGDFSGAGNSIDTDSTILSTGLSYKFFKEKTPLELNLGYQYHALKKKEVVKTANREDGEPGEKIGSPGYTIGGQVHALSLGVSVNF